MNTRKFRKEVISHLRKMNIELEDGEYDEEIEDSIEDGLSPRDTAEEIAYLIEHNTESGKPAQ